MRDCTLHKAGARERAAQKALKKTPEYKVKAAGWLEESSEGAEAAALALVEAEREQVHADDAARGSLLPWGRGRCFSGWLPCVFSAMSFDIPGY